MTNIEQLARLLNLSPGQKKALQQLIKQRSDSK